MKNYDVTIKEIKVKEYETVASNKEEAFNSIMEFYMYEDTEEEDNKTVIEVEIIEQKQ